MKLLLLLLLSGACHAQTGGELGELPTTPPRYDTIPADLIYRTRYGQTGWVMGWEVRKVDSAQGWHQPYDCKIVGCAVNHPLRQRMYATYTHQTYLQSDRRPFPKGTRVARIEGG